MPTAVIQEGTELPCSETGKPMKAKSMAVRVGSDNKCYLYSLVYLLTGCQEQDFAFRQSMCDYIVDENIFQMPIVIHHS